MPVDKQLRDIRLTDVLEKRRLDQALNAKEFAVLASISYSMAREWFHFPGFPVFRGFIFWQDFVRWRAAQTGLEDAEKKLPSGNTKTGSDANLPPRAAKILQEAC
jgi:hypothetical protein